MRDRDCQQRRSVLPAIGRPGVEPLEARSLFNAGDHDGAFFDGYLGTIDFAGLRFSAIDTAVSADGKPVYVGNIGANVAVARLNTDGTLDKTFGSNGVFQTGRRSQVTSVDVQGDGKIILGFGEAGPGNGLTFDFAIGRILADGSDFDSAFGINGIATIGDKYRDSTVNDVVVQRDGKIYAIGQKRGSDELAPFDMAVVRYDTSGNADTTFDGDGLAVIDFDYYDNAFAGALDYSAGGSVGKLVIAGTQSIPGVDADAQFCVARFTTTGTPDNTFDSDGKRGLGNISPSPFEIAIGVGVLANGQIVVAGYAGNNEGGRAVLVTKLNVNGSTDTTFATNGVYQQTFGGVGIADEVRIGYLDNILVSARINGKAAVLAIKNSGTLNSNFSDDGIFESTVSVPRASIDVTGDLISPARRIYLSGGTLDTRIYDLGPIVTIATIQPTIKEAGTTSTTIVVQRSVARNAPETIFIGTSGTALIRGASRDVTTTGITIGNGTTTTTNIVIPAGQLSATFTVTAIDDATSEGDESLTFSVATTSNYDAGPPASTEITIRDNDNAGAPVVTSAAFAYETAQTLTMRFSEDVASSIGDNDFVITGAAGIPSHSFAYNPNNNTVTLSFNGVLPDGNYTATIVAAGVRNAANQPMASNYVFPFFFLNADADRNRSVGFNDLLVLAKNYNQTGKTFSAGNFDYSSDGLVGFNDLLLLAKRYGTTLPTPAAPDSVAFGVTRKRRSGVID